MSSIFNTIHKMRKLAAIFVFLISGLLVQATEPDRGKELTIILVRHAKVEQKRPLLCTANKAICIYKQYNKLPITNVNTDSVRRLIPEKQTVVFTSTMRRAIETAQLLFPEADTIFTSPVLNEYALPMASIPLVPLPYPVWTSLSRFLWVTRLNSHGETRSKALRRMEKATISLIDIANKRGSIVVVCHGYIIRDIRKQLKREGWQLKTNGGNKNLSVTKLIREVSSEKQIETN